VTKGPEPSSKLSQVSGKKKGRKADLDRGNCRDKMRRRGKCRAFVTEGTGERWQLLASYASLHGKKKAEFPERGGPFGQRLEAKLAGKYDLTADKVTASPGGVYASGWCKLGRKAYRYQPGADQTLATGKSR